MSAAIVLATNAEIERNDDAVLPTAEQVKECIFNAQTARETVAKVKYLEDMLKAQEIYGRYASQFCILEAEMILKIASIDGCESKLSDGLRALVRWARTKSSDEISEIMREVEMGTRLRTIRNRKQKENAKKWETRARENEYKRIQSKIILEAEQKGVTSLNVTRFYDEWERKDKPDSSTVRAYVEGTRDELLKLNACGIGDGSGTYALPSVCDRSTLASIVSNRLRSIHTDLKHLKQICDEHSFKVPISGIRMLISALREIEYESPQ